MPLSSSYFSPTAVKGPSGTNVALSGLYHLSLVNPAASSVTGVSNAVAGPNTTTAPVTLNGSLVSGGVAVFDVPRNVSVNVTHATAIVAVTVVVTGYRDATSGPPSLITETFVIGAGGTTTTVAGKIAFRRIISATATSAGNATTDSINIGTGKVFGIPMRVVCPSPVKEMSAGTVVTTGTVVATSAVATDDPLGTYSPSANPNGATTFDAWLIVDTSR
jgi:hypothetical protein